MMRRMLKIVTGILAVLVAGVLLSQWMAGTPPILDENGEPVPNSIAELILVELNDSKQWISIRGHDVENPVLLFLAGGPGGTELASTRKYLTGLERHFVVVNWDQPGAGKSYGAVPHSELTPERYIEDGHALTRYLRERFGQSKIYLHGDSWGSVLGIWLVQRHPDLYHAFIGTGQLVAFLETDLYIYNLALELARERNDQNVIDNLISQGPPPYYENTAAKVSTYVLYLFNAMEQNPQIRDGGQDTIQDIMGSEYGLYDKLNFVRGLIKTMNHVYPQLWDVDLRREATELDVPVYFLLGQHDINAPPAIAEDYFERLEAPHKELIWFERSGHNPWINEPDRFVDVVVGIMAATSGSGS